MWEAGTKGKPHWYDHDSEPVLYSKKTPPPILYRSHLTCSTVFTRSRRIQGTNVDSWHFADWWIANVWFGKCNARVREREMRRAGRRWTMHSAGHRFTAGLWWPVNHIWAGWQGDNTILAKPIDGQNEDRTTPRFNIDQSSPEKGYNFQCVIVLIWLDLTVDVCLHTGWMNLECYPFFALKCKNRTGPHLVFRHVSQLPALYNQDSQNPYHSPLLVQHKQALVEGRVPGLGHESSFYCWIYSILYTVSLSLISSYKW